MRLPKARVPEQHLASCRQDALRNGPAIELPRVEVEERWPRRLDADLSRRFPGENALHQPADGRAFADEIAHLPADDSFAEIGVVGAEYGSGAFRGENLQCSSGRRKQRTVGLLKVSEIKYRGLGWKRTGPLGQFGKWQC